VPLTGTCLGESLWLCGQELAFGNHLFRPPSLRFQSSAQVPADGDDGDHLRVDRVMVNYEGQSGNTPGRRRRSSASLGSRDALASSFPTPLDRKGGRGALILLCPDVDNVAETAFAIGHAG